MSYAANFVTLPEPLASIPEEPQEEAVNDGVTLYKLKFNTCFEVSTPITEFVLDNLTDPHEVYFYATPKKSVLIQITPSDSSVVGIQAKLYYRKQGHRVTHDTAFLRSGDVYFLSIALPASAPSVRAKLNYVYSN